MRILALLSPAILFAGSLEAQYRPRGVLPGTEPTVHPAVVSSSPHTLFVRTAIFDCDVDRVRGREAAGNMHSGTGWIVGGLASGVLLGLIGTGIITAVASSSAPQVERLPPGVEQACYRDGYTARARSMNTMSALTGGLIGTAALLLIIVSASDG